MCLIKKYSVKKGHEEVTEETGIVKRYKVMEQNNDDWREIRPFYFGKYGWFEIGGTMEPKQKEDIRVLDALLMLKAGVIHSYVTLDDANQLFELQRDATNKRIALVECEIPVGAAYWEGCCGECASTKLVLKEVVLMED